jgi:DNA excision repair protein ERCC-8
MNQLLLSRQLGLTGACTFQRAQYERLLHAVTPEASIQFDVQAIHGSNNSQGGSPGSSGVKDQTAEVARAPRETAIAHKGGVNVLTVDNQTGRYLVSGGADAAIRLWDLENRDSPTSYRYDPTSSITRSTAGAHTHALTSLSIYPFDPLPSTILTTSFDKTLKLFSVDTARITPVHTFDVIDTPYTHSLSPIAASAALIAVGTVHPAVRLLDLRTGLTTHTLPGHNGAVFSLCWSPRSEHLLVSGSTDGRVLFFDVRRAHSAFASLDYDDALGVLSPDEISNHQPRPALDWNAKAHDGPVTGVRWADNGRKLITCGHDQRIRVWDAATGRNELVHFGPRIRNARNGEFSALISPAECSRPGKGTLFWPNDDGKGEIFVMDMSEGTLLKVLQRPGTTRNTSKTVGTGKLTSGGRINSMAWRVKADNDCGLELYTGHGDGSMHCWRGLPPEDEEMDGQVNNETKLEKNRKRKRDLLDGLVAGLVKKPMTFI